MKTRLAILCLLILVAFFITNLPLVSAQVISVTPDKDCYSGIEKIIFRGKVKAGIKEPVNIKIENNQGKFATLVSARPDSSGNFVTIPFKAIERLRQGFSYTAIAFIQDQENNKKTTFKFLSSCASGGSSSGNLGATRQQTIAYYDTQLTLQVQDGTSQGYIKVKPTITYGLGIKLATKDVSIYVDGNYKTKVTANQLSSNIYAGSGSHTIKASVGEMANTFDNSIRYRASSDIVNYFIKAVTSVGSTITSSSGSGSGDSFPIEYVIVGIALAAAAAGVGIALSKRKKIAPVISASPAKVQAVQTQDDTQFWVCPHCGGDTEYRNGKQYCSSCKVYL